MKVSIARRQMPLLMGIRRRRTTLTSKGDFAAIVPSRVGGLPAEWIALGLLAAYIASEMR